MIERLKAIIKLLYYAVITLPRDLYGLFMLKYVEAKFRKNEKENKSTAILFERLVKKHPEKPCIIFEDNIWSYQKVRFTLALRSYLISF